VPDKIPASKITTASPEVGVYPVVTFKTVLAVKVAVEATVIWS